MRKPPHSPAAVPSRCQGVAPADSRVFPGLHGGHLDLHSFRAKHWRPALRAAGLEYRKPNALRHTFASFAIAAKVPLFELARFMGTSVKQIEETYGHLLPDAHDRARAALDAFGNSNAAEAAEGARDRRLMPRWPSRARIVLAAVALALAGCSADEPLSRSELEDAVKSRGNEIKIQGKVLPAGERVRDVACKPYDEGEFETIYACVIVFENDAVVSARVWADRGSDDWRILSAEPR